MMRRPANSTNANLSRVRKLAGPRRSERLEQAARLKRAANANITADISRLPSPPSERHVRASKRKREQDAGPTSYAEPPLKKERHFRATPPSEPSEALPDHEQYGAPVSWKDFFPNDDDDAYADNGTAWPMRRTMSEDRANKRPRAPSRTPSRTPSQSKSYTKGSQDGDFPQAWTPQHERRMEEMGLIMSEYQTLATITDDCERLCERLRTAEYTLPDEPAFKKDRVTKVLALVQAHNEARVVRDVMPMVVPSPELLRIDGHAGLEDVCEFLNAEWTKCSPLCGPRPKPDFTGGISTSALTDEEKEKLRRHQTSYTPGLFLEGMYFPFLIAEVKGGRAIEEAERQAKHNSCVAVNAVIKLFQRISAVEEVDRKILAFSIAHDSSTVKIFGHFATVDGDKITFFRKRVHHMDFAGDLADHASHKWARAYKITRAIYDDFFPQHLSRIRSALSRLPTPSLASFTSQLGLEEDSQASTANSSQDDGRFRKPDLPSTVRLQQENDRLRELMEQQLAQQKELMEQQLAQQKEQMERQLEQQKEESREQKAMMERQLEQQKEESREQKAMVERQLEQQKEESLEQKAMMERQLDQQKEQMVQQREIIQLLKESKSK